MYRPRRTKLEEAFESLSDLLAAALGLTEPKPSTTGFVEHNE